MYRVHLDNISKLFALTLTFSMASLRTRVEEVARGDNAKNALLEARCSCRWSTVTDMLQEMLASVEQLTQQCDAAKNELEMARDTARTYYQRLLQAESDNSRIKMSMVPQWNTLLSHWHC